MHERNGNRDISRREALRILGIAGACAAGAGGIASGAVTASGVVREQAMLKRKIPSSGESLPVIGMGTWQTFDVSSAADLAPLEEVLRRFVTLHGQVVDSSPMYGRAEQTVGELVAKTETRHALFLATKVWTRGRKEGIEQMEESLRRLRVPRVDLMQVHNLLDARVHLPILREWKKSGRIRYIGITHYSSSAYGEVETLLRNEPVDFL